jgi:general secretion pathway protein C
MAERGAADQAAAADPAPSGPKAGGDTAGRVTVSSAEIKAATGDLSNLAQQATIRPHFVAGKRDGFLLARVQPRSVFSRLGLRTGDVLKRVDGQVLTSVGQALTLYQSLTPGSEVDVLISRQGVDRTLSYSIE